MPINRDKQEFRIDFKNDIAILDFIRYDGDKLEIQYFLGDGVKTLFFTRDKIDKVSVVGIDGLTIYFYAYLDNEEFLFGNSKLKLVITSIRELSWKREVTIVVY